MLILVGPSASGKSAIVKDLVSKYNMQKFITCTTRKPRLGEVDKVDYYFFTEVEFEKLYSESKFIETVFYNGNYYGTLKSEAGINKVVILEPQGLNSFLEVVPNVFSVFLQTDEEKLKQRMLSRGDSELEMMKRIENDRILFSPSQLAKINLIIDTSTHSVEEISKNIFESYVKYLNEIK